MSRLHILASGHCVLHEPVPPGNNAAGVPWRTALVNSGMGGTSVMPTGTGPGQITAAELAQIAAGALYETAFEFVRDPNWTTAQRNEAMDECITRASGDALDKITYALRWFGATRG